MMITEKAKLSVWSNKEVEMFKPEYFVDYNGVAQFSSELAKKETNDCVVKAFMVALDLPYAYAKNIINTTKNGKKITFIGTHPSRSFFKHSFGSDKVLVNKQYKKPTGYTLKSFMENNPVGRFVLIVQGHAVAVVNGVLYGNKEERHHGLYRSVWYGFEMK